MLRLVLQRLVATLPIMVVVATVVDVVGTVSMLMGSREAACWGSSSPRSISETPTTRASTSAPATTSAVMRAHSGAER